MAGAWCPRGSTGREGACAARGGPGSVSSCRASSCASPGTPPLELSNGALFSLGKQPGLEGRWGLWGAGANTLTRHWADHASAPARDPVKPLARATPQTTRPAALGRCLGAGASRDSLVVPACDQVEAHGARGPHPRGSPLLPAPSVRTASRVSAWREGLSLRCCVVAVKSQMWVRPPSPGPRPSCASGDGYLRSPSVASLRRPVLSLSGFHAPPGLWTALRAPGGLTGQFGRLPQSSGGCLDQRDPQGLAPLLSEGCTSEVSVIERPRTHNSRENVPSSLMCPRWPWGLDGAVAGHL